MFASLLSESFPTTTDHALSTTIMMEFLLHSLSLRGCHRHPISFILIAIIHLISPSYTRGLLSRQTADCTNPVAGTNASCWESLGIPAWLSQFAGPNSTCATSSLANLADAGSSWGPCFVLTINQSDEGQTVAQQMGLLDAYLTADSLDQSALQMMPANDQPRYLDVLRALSRLSQFCNAWNNDVSSYVIGSGIDVPEIVGTLDMETQTSFARDELYRALLLGLPFSIAYNGSFLPAFNTIGIPNELSLEDIGGLLLELAELATVPLSNISASATATEVVEASTILTGLMELSTTLSSRVQDALQSITSDLDVFLNVTANGTFVSAQNWAIPQGPGILLQPLDTYLVSSILAQEDWIILALVGIDVVALSQTSTGSLPAWVLSNCPTCTVPVNFGCSSYNADNQCGRWWYSQNLNSSFTLVQANNSSNDPTELITTIFQQGWTTGELLFENAAICAEPSRLVQTLPTMQRSQRPASPLTDYIDSWFWRLMGVAPRSGTASVDIVVSDAFNVFIASQPGPTHHPAGTIFNITNGKIDFACMSQLDVQLGWNWSGIVAGDFS